MSVTCKDCAHCLFNVGIPRHGLSPCGHPAVSASRARMLPVDNPRECNLHKRASAETISARDQFMVDNNMKGGA